MGLPRPLPVRPLKGQMIALGATVLSRSVMGDDVYLIPRGNETLVGATVEEAGFDVSVTSDAVASLRASAVALYPELADARVTRSWAGIRPATPDMMPILGADPDLPALIYACGHSKNGVLLTPATSVAVAALCLDRPTPTSIAPFSIERFF
jgi:glycine oxidase